MKSYISEETINVLNNLLREMFKANSVADNIAYDLDSKGLHKCSNIYHETFAHYWPDAADEISTCMTKLNARAVRRTFSGDEVTYSGITEAFKGSLDMVENVRSKILSTMDILEYDINNKEIILMLEDLLVEVLDKLYQSNIWFQYAEYYERKDKVMQFDQNFDKFNAPLIGGDSTEDD